jgi:dUTP pyrophosphatase
MFIAPEHDLETGMPVLRCKRLHIGAQMPQYQTAGAACFDLHAVIENDESFWDKHGVYGSVSIAPGGSYDFRIGLAFEVPAGWVMLVYSRSGHGFKHGVRLANGTGVIDSDFRGEMHVKLHNDSDERFTVRHGDRVGQCLLVPAPQWLLREVDELSSTERGENGYGSTGR